VKNKMEKYYKIKPEKINEYSSKLSRSFIHFPCFLLECNLNKEAGVYYFWRLKQNSQDEMVMTAIKLEDLEEIKIF